MLTNTIPDIMNCCHPWLKKRNVNTATMLARRNITKSTTPFSAKTRSGRNDTQQIGKITLFLKKASRYKAVSVNGTM